MTLYDYIIGLIVDLLFFLEDLVKAFKDDIMKHKESVNSKDLVNDIVSHVKSNFSVEDFQLKYQMEVETYDKCADVLIPELNKLNYLVTTGKPKNSKVTIYITRRKQ